MFCPMFPCPCRWLEILGRFYCRKLIVRADGNAVTNIAISFETKFVVMMSKSRASITRQEVEQDHRHRLIRTAARLFKRD